MVRPALALALLFTRFDAPAMLTHPLRRSLLDAARERPGVRVGEIARAFDVDFKTVMHHARMLSRAGLLVLGRDGRARTCRLPGDARASPPPPRVVLALRAVASGAQTPASLSRALGMPRGTAGALLDAMERRGWVARGQAGYRLTPTARAALPPDEAFWPGGGIAA